MTVRASDVRFRGQSGHPLGLDECLLMTPSRPLMDANPFGAYVIMAPSVSTGDGGRNVAGEYLVAEPLDYFHFAEDWGLRVGVTARSRKDLLPRCGK